jgi:hypothetical protein
MEQEAQKMYCFMEISKKIVAIWCIIFDIKWHFFAPFYKIVALKCSLKVKNVKINIDEQFEYFVFVLLIYLHHNIVKI